MLISLCVHGSNQQSVAYPGDVLTVVPPDGEHAAHEEGVEPRGELLGIAALGCMFLKAGQGPDGKGDGKGDERGMSERVL